MKVNYLLTLMFGLVLWVLNLASSLFFSAGGTVASTNYVYRQEADLLKFFFILLCMALMSRRLQNGYLTRLKLDGLSPLYMIFTLLGDVVSFSFILGTVWLALGLADASMPISLDLRHLGVLTGLVQGAWLVIMQTSLALLMLLVGHVFFPKYNALLVFTAWLILHFVLLVLLRNVLYDFPGLAILRWILGPASIIMAYIGPTFWGSLVPSALLVVYAFILHWHLRAQMLHK